MDTRDPLKTGFGAAAAAVVIGSRVVEAQQAGQTVAGNALHANPGVGNDTNVGDPRAPLQTLAKAARRVNASTGTGGVTIVLSEGIHVAEERGMASIWVRPLESATARKLERTESATFPFWSPDSQFIAILQAGKLRRIPVNGGAPLTLADAPAGEGGAWNREGVVVFAPTDNGPLHRVDAAGGASEPVTQLDNGEFKHGGPGFCPTGNGFSIFVRANTVEKTGLYVQQPGSRDRTLVRPTQGRGAVVASGATGALLFMRENALLAQRMNLDDLRLEGEPVSVAQAGRMGGNNGRSAFWASDTGHLVYAPHRA